MLPLHEGYMLAEGQMSLVCPSSIMQLYALMIVRCSIHDTDVVNYCETNPNAVDGAHHCWAYIQDMCDRAPCKFSHPADKVPCKSLLLCMTCFLLVSIVTVTHTASSSLFLSSPQIHALPARTRMHSRLSAKAPEGALSFAQRAGVSRVYHCPSASSPNSPDTDDADVLPSCHADAVSPADDVRCAPSCSSTLGGGG